MNERYTVDENTKYENAQDNIFDVWSKRGVLNQSGEIAKIYAVSVKNEWLGERTLSELINSATEEYVNNGGEENNNDSAQIGSSGTYAQIGSSGDFAQIGSSGDYAQIGSSGNSAKIGSSGDFAKIGSSGDSAQIGSSGYYAKIGSSGDSAQIGSSGNYAQIGSSGDFAQIGSSGDYAKIGSSGNYAKIGSSGDFAKIDVGGGKTVAFACGQNSKIKANDKTWISLAEYDKDGVVCFAKSAQIGNEDYKDAFGNTLSDKYYYQLINKEFTPLLLIDGTWTIIEKEETKLSKKIGLRVMKGRFLDKVNELYIVSNGELNAHGDSLKSAVRDLEFKIAYKLGAKENAKRVIEQGKMNANDYRLLTGSCEAGTRNFLNQNDLTFDDEKTIDEVYKLVVNKNAYQNEVFIKVLEESGYKFKKAKK